MARSLRDQHANLNGLKLLLRVCTLATCLSTQPRASKGFAFVQMQTIEEAKRAVEELHDKEFLGRRLVVSGAKSGEHHAR